MRTLYRFETEIGDIGLEETDGALTRLFLPGETPPCAPGAPTPLLLRAREEIGDYLAGRRKAFSLPLIARGTPFQTRVWTLLRDIPYGQTRSYLDIARALGKAGAARAVGGANHANPLPILIPCHRVVASDGGLGGYGGGTALKTLLLSLERDNAKNLREASHD